MWGLVGKSNESKDKLLFTLFFCWQNSLNLIRHSFKLKNCIRQTSDVIYTELYLSKGTVDSILKWLSM